MLRHILFDLSLFADESDRKNSEKRVLFLLEALVNCNRYWLWQNPDAPLIYQSGIKYINPQQVEPVQLPEVAKVRAWLEKKGASNDVMEAFRSLAGQVGAGECFREIPRIIENGGGDCDNVASWRVAELRELGIWAKPGIRWRERSDGGTTYHVIVLWPDGTDEDPSLLLGMGGEEKAADRAEEVRKLLERRDDFIDGLKKNVVRLERGPIQSLAGALRRRQLGRRGAA